LAMCREQQDAAAVGASKTRLEKMDERHLNLAEGEGFHLHNLQSKSNFTTEPPLGFARSRFPHGENHFRISLPKPFLCDSVPPW